MEEHEYYNLYHRAASSGYASEQSAKRFALELMAVHLRLDHNMKMVDIHRRLKMSMKDLRKIFNEEPQ
jgi:hypothetical protein